MRRMVIAFSLAVATITLTCSQPSYAADFAELISGKNLPLTLKLKNLDNNWRRLTVSNQSETSNWLEIFGAISGALQTGTYYTKGQTVTTGSETYFVVYRLQSTQKDLRALVQSDSSTKFTPAVLTPETTVTLSLLNLRTVNGLNDLVPFNLQQEIEASRRIRESLLKPSPSEAEQACPRDNQKVQPPPSKSPR